VAYGRVRSATIFFMVLFRYAVQTAYLETYLSAARPEVVLQLGPMGLFIAAMIGGRPSSFTS